MTPRELMDVPGGKLWIRRSLCDETVIDEVIVRDCYRLANTNLAGKTVLDVGAHIGVFSTMCANKGASRIVAVEPQLENLELLRLNVAPWPQVDVLEVAVGEHFGRTRIAGESGGSHIELDHPDGVEAFQVTLPWLIEIFDRVDLLKMDIEGGEYDAILNCNHQYLSRVDRIVMETHGPVICPWVETPRVHELRAHLEQTHTVETVGNATHLGLLFATVRA